MQKRFFCPLALLISVGILSVYSQKSPNLQADTLSKSRPPASDLQIKTAVYRDLVGKRLQEVDGQIGAYFLEASKAEIPHLQSVFTNWVPRVEAGITNNIIFTKTGITDRVTTKPATLFWARLESKSNFMVRATGGWHSGPESGGTFKYELRFDGTNWLIQSKEIGLTW